MRTLLISFAVVLAATPGCKKKHTGGWLVGEDRLMEAVDPDGHAVGGYALSGSGDLAAIDCADDGDAYVVGEGGTFLRTADGGDSWTEAQLGAGALHAVAAAADGVVVIAGADRLDRSDDAGATWRPIATGGWRDVAIDPRGETIVAVDAEGGLWRGGDSLAPVTGVAGAVLIATAEGGSPLWAVGTDTAWRSTDGVTWEPIAFGTALELHDATIDDDGALIAVGAAGAIVRVDGGAATVIAAPTTGGLDAVHIDDEGGGFAGGEGGALLRTDDGGTSWRVLDHAGPRILGLDQVGDDGKL